MSNASSTPCRTHNLLSVCIFFLCSGLHLSLNSQSGTGSCLGPVLQKREGGEARGGCTDYNEMHSVNGHSLWRGQEEKGTLSVFLSSPLSVPRPPALSLSLSISCPPPQLAMGFVRRQMIPQMPRPSRPLQLHSPASPQVRGHHRASEWVSVATVAMAVERVAEAFCCRLVAMDRA